MSEDKSKKKKQTSKIDPPWTGDVELRQQVDESAPDPQED
jgi:hypothetical protein